MPINDDFELTTKMISNKKIMKAVLLNNQEMKVEESNSNPLLSIAHNETIEYYDRVIIWYEVKN